MATSTPAAAANQVEPSNDLAARFPILSEHWGLPPSGEVAPSAAEILLAALRLKHGPQEGTRRFQALLAEARGRAA